MNTMPKTLTRLMCLLALVSIFYSYAYADDSRALLHFEPIHDQQVTIAIKFQKMIYYETSVNPQRVYVQENLEINNENIVTYRMIDAVVFNNVPNTSANKIIKAFQDNKNKNISYKLFWSHESPNYKDLILVNNIVKEDLCALHIIDFSKNKNGVCYWRES